jgi:glycosyltransferase involved in cell wall biosynthesis
MNILLLAPHPFFQNRGTPIAVKTLVQVLTESGHKVDMLAYHEGEDVRIDGCRLHRIAALPGVHGIRPGFSFKKLACDGAMFFKAYSMLRENRYDLLHAVEESAFLAWFFSKLFGVPYLYDMDSSLAQQMMEKYPWLVHVRGFLERSEKLAVNGSVGVIAVCKSLQDTAHGYDPHKPVLRLEDITLLDWENTSVPEAENSLGMERPIAMYVGNLEAYQGIDLLLDAFKVTKDGGTHGSLVIVGGSEADIAKYKQKSSDLGISDSVFLLGPRPVEHLAAYLSRADVLLSPRTKGYNTPMKIYSYLDSGKPLLATRLPTHTQVLDDEISFLADPGPLSMGRGLARLFEDGELSQRLADNAKRRVEAEFTLEAFRRKLTTFYGQIEAELRAGSSAVEHR